jgi:antitoxin component YwqK of YwqJK toxin-antitoxin module
MLPFQIISIVKFMTVREYSRTLAITSKYFNNYAKFCIQEKPDGLVLNNCCNYKYNTQYKQGRKEGLYEEYDRNNIIRTRSWYKNNKLNGPLIKWHNNSKLEFIGYYIDDNSHGEFKTYHYNGLLSASYMMINGMLHGDCKDWDSNGHLVSSANYEFNRLCGYKQMYDEDGEITYVDEYNNELSCFDIIFCILRL